MKVAFTKLGVLAVFGLAFSAVFVNQQSAAKQMKMSPLATLSMKKKISAADPNFKWAAAVAIAPIKDKIIGHKIDADMWGSFVFSETFYKTTSDNNTFFTRSVFWFEPDFSGKIKQMTPSQLALAETLFKNVNLGRAKNLSVTQNGIMGSVTAREIGMRSGQLEALTRTRLQQEIKTQTAALGGLARQ